MSYLSSPTYSRSNNTFDKHSNYKTLQSNSQRPDYSSNSYNLHKSSSSKDLQPSEHVKPLVIDTRLQPRGLNDTAESYRDNQEKDTNHKFQTTSELSTALLSEAVGLENINSSLLELTKNRFEIFMTSVKQFMGVSSKLSEHVSAKNFDAKVALDKFKSQRSVIEKNIVQIENSIQKVNLELNNRRFSFQQLLTEGYLLRIEKDGSAKEQPGNRAFELSSPSNSSRDANENSSNDISSSMLEDDFNAQVGLQKLKSLVTTLEQQNKSLLSNLSPQASAGQHFYSSSPSFFNTKGNSLPRDEYAFPQQQQPVSAYNSQSRSAVTSPKAMLYGASKKAGSNGNMMSQTQQEVLDLKKANAELQNYVAQFADRLGRMNEANQGLSQEVQQLEENNKDLEIRHNRLQAQFESDKSAHEEYKKLVENRDAAILEDFEYIVDSVKTKIANFGNDFDQVVEGAGNTPNTKKSRAAQQDNEYLKKFVEERLADLEKILVNLDSFTKQSLGSVKPKERVDIQRSTIPREILRIFEKDRSETFTSNVSEDSEDFKMKILQLQNILKRSDVDSVNKLDSLKNSLRKREPDDSQTPRKAAEARKTHSFQGTMITQPSVSPNQLQILEKENEVLKTEYTTLQEAFKTLQEKNKSLERLYTEKVSSLSGNLEDLKIRNKTLVDSFSRSQDRSNSRIRELTEKIEILNPSNRVNAEVSQDRESASELKNLKNKVNTYESTIGKLQEEKRVLADEKGHLLIQLERTKKFNETNNSASKSPVKSLHSDRRHYTEIRQEQVREASPLESRNKTAIEQFKRQEEIITRLVQEKKQLKSQLDNIHHHQSAPQRELYYKQEVQPKPEEARADVVEQVKELEIVLNKTQEKEKVVRAHVRTLSNEKEELLAKVKDAEVRKDKLSEDVENLKRQNQSLVDNKVELEKELNKYGTNEKNLLAEIQSLNNQRVVNEKRIKDLEAEISGYKESLARLEQQISKLKQTEQQVDNQDSGLENARNDERAEEMRVMQEANQKLNDNIKQLEEELSVKSQELKSLREEIKQQEKLKQEVNDLGELIESKEDEIRQLKAQIEEEKAYQNKEDATENEKVVKLEKELKEKRGEVEKLCKEMSAIQKHSEELKSRLEQEITVKNQEIEEVKKQLVAKENELQKLREEEIAKEKAHKEEERRLQQKIAAIEDQLRTLEEENNVKVAHNEQAKKELEFTLEAREQVIKQIQQQASKREKDIEEAHKKFSEDKKEKEEELERLKQDFNVKERNSKEAYNRLKEELEQFKKDLTAKGQGNDQAIRRLHGDLRTREEELENLREILEMRNKENKEIIRSFEKDLKNKSELLEKIDKENEEKEIETKKMVEKHGEIVQNKEEEVKKAKQETEAKQKENLELKEKLTQETNHAKKSIESLEKEIQRMKEELSTLKEESKQKTEASNQLKAKLEGEVKELKDKLQEAQAIITRDGAAAKDLEVAKKNLEALLQAKEKEIENLGGLLEERESEIREKAMKISNLEEIQGIEQERKKSEVNIHDILQNKNSEIIRLTSEAQKDHKEFETKINKLKEDYKNLETTYNQTVQTAQTDKQKLEHEFSELTTANEALRNQLEKTERTYNQTKAELEMLRAEAKNTKRKLQEAEQRREEANTTIVETQQSLTDAQSRLEESRARSSDLEKQLAASQEEIKKITEEAKRLSETVKLENQAEIDKKVKEIDALQALKGSLETELSSLRERIVALEKSIQDKEQQIAQRDSKIKQAYTDLQVEKDARKKDAQEGSSRLNELAKEKQTLEGLQTRLQGEIERLKTQISQLKSNLESAHHNHQSQVEALEASIKAQAIDNETLGEKLGETVEATKKLEGDIQGKENVIKDLKAETQDLRGQLKQTRDDLQVKENEVNAKIKQANGLQEAMREIDRLRNEKEQKVIFLTEEVREYKISVEERVREVGMIKSELMRVSSENDRLYEEKATLSKTMEGLKEAQTSGNKKLVKKYEEIIAMNKKTIEEKDRSVIDLRREIDAVKMSMSASDIESERTISELKHRAEQVFEKNTHLERENNQLKQQKNQHADSSSKEASRLKSLVAIVDTLVDYSRLAKQDENAALDALRERVKELITKEGGFEIQVAENETLTFKLAELGKVMELQSKQDARLQEIITGKLRFLDPELSQQQINAMFASLNAGASDKLNSPLNSKIEEDIAKRIVVEKRIEFRGHRWCIISNCSLEKKDKKYIIQKDEEVMLSPLKAKANAVKVFNLEATYDMLEEVRNVVKEAEQQINEIESIAQSLVAQKIENSVTLTIQSFNAVTKSLLSRVNLVIYQDLKDEQTFKVLEECDREADILKQNIIALQEETKTLKTKVMTTSRKSQNKVSSNPNNTSKGSIHPKFTLDEDNGTISEIKAGEVSPLHKSIGDLEQILEASPSTNAIQDEIIKALEVKVDALSSVQEKLIIENNDLKETLETYSNLVKENDNLRYTNAQHQIDIEQAVEELKERDNDEMRYQQQINVLKTEIGDLEGKLRLAQSTHEKEHLKKILVKFLDSVIKGEITQETFEWLKILCSLVFCTDDEKKNLHALLTRLQAKKKQGGFMGIF